MDAWNPGQIIAQAEQAKSDVVKMDMSIEEAAGIMARLNTAWQDNEAAALTSEFNKLRENYGEFSAEVKSFLDRATNHAERIKAIGG